MDRTERADAELDFYLLGELPVRLDPERGPVDPEGRRVDCRAWMDHSVRIAPGEYAARLQRVRPPVPRT